MPPPWLIRDAVAAVWAYEGLWCKLLHGQPHELKIVESVPYFGAHVGRHVFHLIGVVEILLAGWACSGADATVCAVVQTVLLVAMNTAGLVSARHLIPDPGGMVVKNCAFLTLVWVSAAMGRAT